MPSRNADLGGQLSLGFGSRALPTVRTDFSQLVLQARLSVMSADTRSSPSAWAAC